MRRDNFLTEEDLKEIEGRLSEVFMTKEEFQNYRSELFDKLDQILGEVMKSREEQTIIGHQIDKHEDRLTSLETGSS